jgi:hypothetical protein
MKRVTALLAVAPLLAGCVGSVRLGAAGSEAVFCPTDARAVSAALVLMAQAVPTASRVPCVSSLAEGFTVGDLDARSGRARYALRSDAHGQDAVLVTLTRACPPAGVGAAVGGRALSDWQVQVHGGCISYHLDPSVVLGSQTRTQIRAGLSLVDRSVIARAVRESNHGHPPLDPTTTEANP